MPSPPSQVRQYSFSASSSDETDSQDSGGHRNSKKHPWSSQEDEALRILVDKYGARDWGKIASQIVNRNGKQCHQRWNYFLNPKVRKGVWTDDEDRTILYFQNLLGNKWAKIANSLPGRTGHAVKNRFHQISNHLKRRTCVSPCLVNTESARAWSHQSQVAQGEYQVDEAQAESDDGSPQSSYSSSSNSERTAMPPSFPYVAKYTGVQTAHPYFPGDEHAYFQSAYQAAWSATPEAGQSLPSPSQAYAYPTHYA